jgi:hypothetical protein
LSQVRLGAVAVELDLVEPSRARWGLLAQRRVGRLDEFRERRRPRAGALLQYGRPPYTRVRDLERKLCCTGCGNRRGNTVTVSMAPRN